MINGIKINDVLIVMQFGLHGYYHPNAFIIVAQKIDKLGSGKINIFISFTYKKENFG